MNNNRDERSAIFVRVTPPGTGGIATLIIDGADLSPLLQPFVKSKQALAECRNGDLIYARLFDSTGALIDEIILAFSGKTDTATGNEQFELSCHGGAGVLKAVEETLCEAGIVAGRPTELLERAHLNSKLSLIAIEARIRLARAVTPRQAEFLLSHPLFQQKWERLGFDMAMGMRTKDESWRTKLTEFIERSLEQREAGTALLRPHRVTIIGPVNAGKSTLLNLLAREERHIVSPIPGTTLDRLDTQLSIRGLSLVMTDTAGIRATSNAVEAEGQQRGSNAAAHADFRLVVLDGSKPADEQDLTLIERSAGQGKTLLVLNKSDLGVHPDAGGLGFMTGADPVVISAQSGNGLKCLEDQIEHVLLQGKKPDSETPFTIRQIKLLKQLRDGLSNGTDANELLGFLRRLIGTRPNRQELAQVLV